MKQSQIIATWLSFANHTLKRAWGLSHEQYLAIEKRYHIITFLLHNYELLHYYDNDYVVSDTERYISEQGGQIP